MQQPTTEMVLVQAKKQKETLERRIGITRQCVEVLEKAMAAARSAYPVVETESESASGMGPATRMMYAMHEVQLLQLKAALEEGEPELDLINSVIERASNPPSLLHANLVPPSAGLIPGRFRK